MAGIWQQWGSGDVRDTFDGLDRVFDEDLAKFEDLAMVVIWQQWPAAGNWVGIDRKCHRRL